MNVIRKARFYETECGNELPEPGPFLGWMCTRQRGHEGVHVAHDIDGSLITTWTSGDGITGNNEHRPRNLDISPAPVAEGSGAAIGREADEGEDR